MRRVLGTPVIEYLPALGLWLATAAYLVLAYGYPADARAVPVLVAWTMIVLVGLDLASRTETKLGRTLTRWLNPAARESAPQGAPIARQVLAVLWVLGFVAALVVLGILAAVPLYVFTFMRFSGRRSYLASCAASACATVFIWLLFAQLLRLDLYPGLLFGGGA